MMEPTDTGALATFCGGITACAAGASYTMNESTVILIISFTGAMVGAIGLVYTVWNSERIYRMARAEHEARMKRITKHLHTEEEE